MTALIDIFIITLMVVFVIDLSGFIEEMEKILAKWMKAYKVHIPKPFSCSLCSTWWIGLIYLIFSGHFTIPFIGYVALMAFLTPVWYSMLLGVKELLLRIMNKID